ncbi:hypothetical protein MTR_7g064200 [Medicago truncatula]|uniref:Uncharacterized protein n=1 Tax=Medicago truncatula TaxID=3880 RepID=A0A072TZT2_MEDTR|nr:hypothetical protein MTR_7g064200 [Medicago truncatula]
MDDGHPCSSTRNFKIFWLAKANRHTLPISSGYEKSNLIPVSDGFGYPRLILIPAVNIFL